MVRAQQHRAQQHRPPQHPVEPTGAEVRRARMERDAVLAAVADGEDALRMRAAGEGLDAAEMALLEDLDVLDAQLYEQRRSA